MADRIPSVQDMHFAILRSAAYSFGSRSVRPDEACGIRNARDDATCTKAGNIKISFYSIVHYAGTGFVTVRGSRKFSWAVIFPSSFTTKRSITLSVQCGFRISQ
jgi:hypothetical protein